MAFTRFGGRVWWEPLPNLSYEIVVLERTRTEDGKDTPLARWTDQQEMSRELEALLWPPEDAEAPAD